ncbi:aspartate/glutamate racemase family protein [Chengkuizengella axinellae]|uniref:Amino acid racemase n=1 Tax=Chengkuizengella axinellae TaxID=3064388 RepID=A0ABT9J1K8_9BACL|nr:amino acid racemase [Chengkuizengella sp. 2205SS18-9]MDP5275483.1 amino acid racemase [Chengkuizengella sp. 2205SS18-9]
MSKVIGIIGGMGPMATVDLMEKIIANTPAKQDQEHIHVIADNNSQIPDRTSAILGRGKDPTPWMIQSAQRLQNAGAEILVMACNTAHFFYNAVRSSIHIPILHIPLETAYYLKINHYKSVGLLATDGTIKSKLYQRYFENFEINYIPTDEILQEKVMEGIYEVKGGKLETGSQLLSEAAEQLISNGADAIIAGCTEVPLVLHSTEDCCVIDPTEIIANKVIEVATDNRELFPI